MLFAQYGVIARTFHWGLTEVKELSRRERAFWYRVSLQISGQATSADDPDSPI